MTLHCRRLDDAAAFLEVAGAFLSSHEAENTIALGAALGCRDRTPDGAGFWIVVDAGPGGDAILLAATHLPPRPLALSHGDDRGVPALAAGLQDGGVTLSGVVGQPPLAQDFARAWSAATGVSAMPAMTMTMHHLTAVAPVPAPPGRLRPAEPADAGWIADWIMQFIAETGLPASEAQGARSQAESGIERGRFFVWEDDRSPVAMAGITTTAPAGDGGRLGPVRTAPAMRGRGCATACVAALSHRQLSEGWRYCLILTDDRNPVTGRIYSRVGYRAIGKQQMITFGKAA